MQLKKWDRVRYTRNPLVEVIAQVRFPRFLEIDDRLPADFQRRLMSEYPLSSVEEQLLSISVGPEHRAPFHDGPSKRPVYHFASADNAWRVSLCSEFVALTCRQYDKWENFKPRMLAAIDDLRSAYPIQHRTRIGLRYVDVIVREDIGLGGVPWRELVAPFLLGVAAADEICASGAMPESAVTASQSSTTLRLETCQVSLRHGLVMNAASNALAYMIDSDLYIDAEPQSLNTNDVADHLDNFHRDANSIFRSAIKPRVHDALGPSAVS